MKLDLSYVTSSGAEIPVYIQIERLNPDRIIEHQIHDIKQRNSWCTNNKPCSKFGQRPCCPPKCKLFDEMKRRKYMYLMSTMIILDEYYEVYPNVRDSKSWCYFGMDGTHKMTRNINNAVSTSFEGQAFRVGGCLGCQYTKSGKCKRFAPPLEATGVNVVELAKDVFDIDIVWREDKKPMSHMVAVGGIYTDESISPKRLKKAIMDVCNKGRR